MRTRGVQQVEVSSRAGSRIPQVVSVPYLNALPLIDGLSADPQVRLSRAAPSRLAAMLERGRIDAALLPSIDLQRMTRPPIVLTAGCIGSNGAAETVRVFSRVPPSTIRQLYVDTDSHTSVALAAVLWAESFGRRLEMAPLRPGRAAEKHPIDAVLVIGDKVVSWPTEGYRWQLDLGAAWRELTELPFVFAVWAMRADADDTPRAVDRKAAFLTKVLGEARIRGMGRIEEIALRYASKFGWPADRAKGYLTENIQYKFTPAHRRGMETFFHLAHKHELIDKVRPLTFAGES